MPRAQCEIEVEVAWADGDPAQPCLDSAAVRWLALNAGPKDAEKLPTKGRVLKAIYRHLLCLAMALAICRIPAAQAQPQVTLRSAPHLVMPGAVDSNSPAHWDGDTFYLFNSVGHPYRAQGPDLFSLGTSQAVSFNNSVNGGRWMEATWKADDGALYGWYHFEPQGVCPGTGLTAPQIGAVRSTNNGTTWQDLGVIMSAPPCTINCQTQNTYFAGGHGDFSVMLDDNKEWLYFWYGSYGGDVSKQGVAMARMAWNDRDSPIGQVWKWDQNAWQEPGLGGHVTPLFPATTAWELPNANAFWGPSVHWNTYLNEYVMLLNRANNSAWGQEGIYVSFATDISSTNWTQPQKIFNGGGWYPQVIGTGASLKGTDKLAGQAARFFMHGVSDWEIVFNNNHPVFTQFLDGSVLPGAAGWTVDGDPGTIVNLGGGNFGIRQTDDNSGAGTGRHGRSYDEYYLTLADPTNTLATRFRVDNYNYSGSNFIDVLALTGGSSADSPAIGVGIRNIGGQDRWVLLRFIYEGISPGDPAGTLLDIAPVVPGEFNEALIHVDSLTDLVRFSWNGVELYNAVTPTDWNGTVGYPEFGASNYWGEGGTSSVTYDWVGYGPGYIAPGIAGDYNNDGKVDAADYVLWRKNVGTSNRLSNDPIGGTIDADQYNQWRAHFGQMAPSAAAGQSDVAVPEPTALGLLLIAILAGIASGPARMQTHFHMRVTQRLVEVLVAANRFPNSKVCEAS